MDTYEILNDVKDGKISIDDAILMLKKQPFENLGYANVDYHRHIRQGENEVIYGEGKTPEQIVGIAKAMIDKGIENILVTRLNQENFEIINKTLDIKYFDKASIGVVNYKEIKDPLGKVCVVSAGTSDMNVSEEAAVTAEILGSKVERIYDVGVSGLHRLMARLDDIMTAKVIIAVAGMEGALASVIGGLVSCPVIAVPTSVGYGANYGGLSTLLAMLNSCSSGVSVVNIDNGFGAGYLANMINKIGEK